MTKKISIEKTSHIPGTRPRHIRLVRVDAALWELCSTNQIQLVPGTPEHFNDWSVLLIELALYLRAHEEMVSFRDVAHWMLGIQEMHVQWFKQSCEEYLSWKNEKVKMEIDALLAKGYDKQTLLQQLAKE